MKKAFYLTTTLPYVNDKPHLGHALEFVQADVIARYHRGKGEEVFFNTGTDEHGQKIYQKAVEAGESPQAYTDRYAERFKELLKILDIQPTRFIRTTDPDHVAAAQEFWKLCLAKGDIEKKIYKIKYCVGCELEKTESDLEDGKCPLHPNLSIQENEEDNYFFKFSKYQQPLLDLYDKYPDFVLPDNRLTEIRNFVSGGLQDFSVSRLKSKMPWGIPVPNDDEHVLYVWFDALINYVSTLGWGDKSKVIGQKSKVDAEDFNLFTKFWGRREEPNAMQIAGKDNLRQQSAMWQAMLLSAGLPTSRQILIHGFITSGGVKMSKTIGNVIDPMEIIEAYGPEAFRFFMTHDVAMFEDSDITREKLKESYNTHLANGLGNLVQRVMKMASTYQVQAPNSPPSPGFGRAGKIQVPNEEYAELMEKFELQKAIELIWAKIQACDKMIQEREPFKVFKVDPEAARKDVQELMGELTIIAEWLKPFMPETSQKISAALESGQLPAEPLFMRM